MSQVKESWDNLYGYLLNKDQPGSIIDKYDRYAVHYDKDLGNLGYGLPAEVAGIVANNVKGMNDLKILDVGVGTGLLGANLKKLGVDCVIDGIDGSQGMLDVAAKLGEVYATLKRHMLTIDNPLPFPDVYYNVSMSSGCFSPQHIESEMVEDMIRVVKKGGLVIVTSRDDVEFAAYRDEMEGRLKKLVEDDVVKMIETAKPDFFAFNYYRDDPSTPSSGKCWVMKKL
uniref:methyltransferase-like protein 27 n=1 Tax=Ciona intestinalis TaxID=7719 RepID=UPI0002B8D6BB|nr:methyltransferase-like protein 27 [Ciona intestinalis]|eukprot:XP_004227231.1 methyltransferase-like protein 27 [Ciona intestinalis]